MSKQKTRVAKLESETGAARDLVELRLDDLLRRGSEGDKDALREALRITYIQVLETLEEHPPLEPSMLDDLRANGWFEDEVTLFVQARSLVREALQLFAEAPFQDVARTNVCSMEGVAAWKQLRELRNSRVFIREVKRLCDLVRPALQDCPECLARLDEGYEELLREHPGLVAA